ncbi:MAG: hypothetical protein WC483_03920 [Candidatus Paceibacterota bacterium]
MLECIRRHHGITPSPPRISASSSTFPFQKPGGLWPETPQHPSCILRYRQLFPFGRAWPHPHRAQSATIHYTALPDLRNTTFHPPPRMPHRRIAAYSVPW